MIFPQIKRAAVHVKPQKHLWKGDDYKIYYMELREERDSRARAGRNYAAALAQFSPLGKFDEVVKEILYHAEKDEEPIARVVA